MIYLDNSATTPLCEKAIEHIELAMKVFGNPSSLHSIGLEAERLREASRESVMKALGVRKFSGDRLIFTSGGTEANNLAIFGSVYSKPSNKGKKIITTDSEHPSVLTPFKTLEKEGYKVIYLSTKMGKIDMDELRNALDMDTVFISIMSVNNETGAMYDVKEIFSLAKRINPKITTHTDCVQGFLKIPFSPTAVKADLVSISSHKIHGPKGTGALYVSADTIKTKRLIPFIQGGGQEGNYRSGTENMLGICGFGGACEYGFARFEENTKKMRELRDHLTENIKDLININEPETAAPHVVNITLPDIRSETMLHYLSKQDIYISSGSACSSNHAKTASHVLLGFGLGVHEAESSIRISLSENNTKEELDIFVSALKKGIEELVHSK